MSRKIREWSGAGNFASLHFYVMISAEKRRKQAVFRKMKCRSGQTEAHTQDGRLRMKESIDCPKLVEQSKKVQKGQHWLVELLVFVTVYIIAAFGDADSAARRACAAEYEHGISGCGCLRGYGTAVGGVGADCGFGCLRGVKAFSGIAMLLVVVLFCKGSSRSAALR